MNPDDDEKTQQKRLGKIMYYEVRHVLCLWMKKLFFNGYGLNPTNAREDHNIIAGLDPDAVNKRYKEVQIERLMDAGANFSDLAPGGIEPLLNLLERIHRVVYSYPQEDREVKEILLEDPNMPTAKAELIVEFDANKIEWSAPPRQHGRSRCTCRLQHSNASNNDKKDRIDQIRRLVCNEWEEELDLMLQIIPDQAGYLPGDGPFKHTKDDPFYPGSLQPGIAEDNDGHTMKRLNEMLLTLWRIIGLPDAPVFYPQPESTCPECTHGWWCTHTDSDDEWDYAHYY